MVLAAACAAHAHEDAAGKSRIAATTQEPDLGGSGASENAPTTSDAAPSVPRSLEDAMSNASGSVPGSVAREDGASSPNKRTLRGSHEGSGEESSAGAADDVVAVDTPAADIGVPGRETMVAIATPTPTRTPTRTATSTPTRTPTPPAGTVPVIGGCGVFPANNTWNTDISSYPVHANSQNFINNILAGSGTDKLHPDFGSNPAYGIPYIVVAQSEPMIPVNFTDYGDESDPGPYPIPLNAPNEGGGDRHVIAVQQGTCMLYELFNAWPQTNRWDASSGAKWNLATGALRPEGWTSADAAGLPILPGLVRYDEVQAGTIRHALRFTVQATQRGYILPATHFASSSTDPNRPPMGLRLRLKASYDISGYTGQARVILEALRRYGMIVADNGSNWYISGARDPRWDDDDLNQLKNVPGSAFEAVYTGPSITP
jgi:hypothetical protein